MSKFNHGKTVHIYAVYETDITVNISSYSTLENFLFGAVKLAKHVKVDQCKNSGFGIGFDRKCFFSVGDEVGRNFIIFGANMSLSFHTIIRKKIF